MKRISYLIVSLLIVVVLVLIACAPSDGDGNGDGDGQVPECGTPEYGSTLTTASTGGGPTGGDPGQDPRETGYIDPLVFNRLLMRDQSKPLGTAITLDGFLGVILESWEEVSPTHFILHVRQGIKFQNKPPVNGRELTAYDIEYCVHRFLGLGSGYDTPSVWLNMNVLLKKMPIESVTATDTYTVEIKLGEPYLHALQIFLAAWTIYPREIIDTYGNMLDWHNLVGSGPFMLSDYAVDSYTKYVKNPDYFGFDERYPGNKLPYADAIEVLVIPDDQTRMAAMRTGQINSIAFDSAQRTLAADLKRTNPELKEYLYSEDAPAFMIDMNHENSKPLDDIKVRIALQKSINLEEIAEEYYDGTADPTPFGQLGDIPPYNYPYAEWPASLKAEYSYDPAGAKALLEQAGYPDGFTVEIWDPGVGDPSLLLLITDYFDQIGVTSNVRQVDMQAYAPKLNSQTAYGLTWFYYSRMSLTPWSWVGAWHYNRSGYGWRHNEPAYDDLVDAMLAATTEAEQRQLVQQCDKYGIEKHFALVTGRTGSFFFMQPWLCGVDAAGAMAFGSGGSEIARTWICQECKK